MVINMPSDGGSTGGDPEGGGGGNASGGNASGGTDGGPDGPDDPNIHIPIYTVPEPAPAPAPVVVPEPIPYDPSTGAVPTNMDELFAWMMWTNEQTGIKNEEAMDKWQKDSTDNFNLAMDTQTRNQDNSLFRRMLSDRTAAEEAAKFDIDSMISINMSNAAVRGTIYSRPDNTSLETMYQERFSSYWDQGKDDTITGLSTKHGFDLPDFGMSVLPKGESVSPDVVDTPMQQQGALRSAKASPMQQALLMSPIVSRLERYKTLGNVG